MPCGMEELTLTQAEEKALALEELERRITDGVVQVVLDGDTVTFQGWETRRDGPGHWHDDCAFRTLMAEGSFALQTALASQGIDQSTLTQFT